MANPAMHLQPSGARLSFDGFELDEVDARLTGHGQPVRIQPRHFHRHAPAVIKDQTAMPALASSMQFTPARRAEDHELMTMSRVFAEHGGVVTADALARSMRANVYQPLSIVGGWIAERAAVQFKSRSQTWFPRFQFAGNPLSILPAVHQIVLELRDAYDDWELALWFARRNVWLDHVSPVEMIQRDAAAAVRAAQADRLIAKG
jgi:hypothetical protein